jgi:hypothetical protein
MSASHTSHSPFGLRCTGRKSTTASQRRRPQYRPPGLCWRFNIACDYSTTNMPWCQGSGGKGGEKRRAAGPASSSCWQPSRLRRRRLGSGQPVPARPARTPSHESRPVQKRHPGRDGAQLREPCVRARSGAPADALAPVSLTNTDGALSPPSLHTLREEIAHSAAILI